MKRMFCAVLAALLIAAALTACSKQEEEAPAQWPVQVGELTLTEAPKRVVTLSPALTETVYLLGYGGRVAGVSQDSELPSAAQELPDCGTALFPDVEAIRALDAELLLSSSELPASAAQALEESGVAIMVIEWADSLEGVYKNYGAICTAFEGSDTGALRERQLRYFGDAMLRNVIASLQPALQDPAAQPGETSIIWLRRMPLLMATGDTMEGRWLSEMGFVNQADAYTGWDYPVEFEPDLNPDIILLDDDIPLEEMTEHVYYYRTNAVRGERIAQIDSAAFERQSPRMFFELRGAMRELFPDAVSEQLPDVAMPLPKQPEPEPKTGWEAFVDGLPWNQ